jgi:hypothetical protein
MHKAHNPAYWAIQEASQIDENLLRLALYKLQSMTEKTKNEKL